jgi:hypothetical protein
MPFILDTNATIVNDARWPGLTLRSRPGNSMDQYVIGVRSGATNLRLLYANNTPSSTTIEVAICKGFRSPSNLPVRVTFGGSNSVTIPAYESAQSDLLSNISTVVEGDLLLVRTFLAAAQNIAGGVQGSIAYNSFGTSDVPVNAFGQRATNYWSTVADSNALTAADDSFEASFSNNGNHQQALLTPVALIGIPTDANGPRLGVLVGDSKTTSNLVARTHSGLVNGSNEESVFGAFQPRLFGLHAESKRAYYSHAVPSTSATSILGNSAQQLLMKSLLAIPSGHGKQPIFVYRYGTNSLGNSAVIATAVANEYSYIQQFLALMLPDTKCVVSTCDPVAKIVAGSGGAWATITEAQQENGGNNNNGIDMMNTYNAILRDSKPSYITRVADCAAVVTVLPSGKWLPNATNDGIHQNTPFSILQAVPLRTAIDAVEADYRRSIESGTVKSVVSHLVSGLVTGVCG